MADLTLDGLDIREATRDGIFLDLMSGFYEPPTWRGTDTVIPSADGRVPRNRIRDVRRVILDGYVTGTTAADMAANVQTLMTTLDQANANDPSDLVVTTPYLGTAGGPYTLAVRYVNCVPGPPMYGVKYQAFSIELESVTPEWSS